MTKQASLFLFLILGLNGFTQNSFVPGYYIDNSNERIDCFIKNVDWLNNPTEFEYKLSENSEEITQTIISVKEFEILNVSKYVRQNVDIDRSSGVIDEMGYNKNPVFKKEQLFLKVLIEGKANLYLYEDSGLIRYFFNQDFTDVKQLIFKNYLTDDGQIAKNNEFRRQLWNTLKCESISMDQLAKINYRQSELIKFFIKYNECKNSGFINYQTKQKKDLFNLTIRPGIRSSSLLLGNGFFAYKPIDFGKGLISYRLGLEAEFLLGFNNNKWALIVEPTYQNFEAEGSVLSNESTGEELISSVNHESIQINLGIRYYVFLNNDFKLFANALGIYSQSLNNSSIKVDGSIATSEILSSEIVAGMNSALGIGCKYKDRYNLELRYLPKTNLLRGSWGTEFTTVAIILGYTIF